MNIRLIVAAVMAACYIPQIAASDEVPADSLTRQLQEVVVTAKQPVTRLEGTTLVSTIAGSNLVDLGNALDVLAQLPLIKVQDSEVSVTGKSDISIYIDGRPMRDREELALLQSSNLAKVELLMAPGAMYESTTGAVIKITTRRRFVQGLSVTDQFKLQRRRKWSAVDFLSVDYSTGAWNFFAEGSFNHDSPVISGRTVNCLTVDDRPVEIGSSQHNRRMVNNTVTRVGVNYSAGEQSFGAYHRFAPEHGRFTNSGTEWFGTEPAMLRDIYSGVSARTHLAAVYYDNRFADRYHLHFDGDFRTSTSDTSVDTSYPEGDHAAVNSTEHKRSDLAAAKLYMEFPLAAGNFNAGVQGSWTRTRLDYRMLNDEVGTYIPSSLTGSRQTSGALFASWQRMFGRVSLSAGLRYEYVDYGFTVNGVRDSDVSRRDNLLTPDISLGYSFGDRASLSLSYKMVTVRPPYSQLTGSLSYVGIHEIEGGNTALRDEHMHNLQLSGMWGDFMLHTGLCRSLDTYAFVKQRYEASTLQLLMHPVNIDVSSLSAYLIWSRAIRRWTPEITAGVYAQRLSVGGGSCNRPIWSYDFSNTLVLPKGFMLTANISGSSAGYMHTNRFRASWFSMDMSVSKHLFNKALQLALSAVDLFNTVNYDWSMLTYGVSVDKRQRYDRRCVTLGVTYSFQPRQRRYKGEAAAQSELNRL